MSWNLVVQEVQPKVQEAFNELRQRAVELRAKDIEVEQAATTTQR